MALLPTNRKRLLAGVALLTLVIGLAGLWYGNSPANNNTNTGHASQQTVPDTTASDFNTQGTVPATVIVSVPDPSQQNTAANNATTLPPISREVANEIRKLSLQNSDGLVAVKEADGSTSMDLQGHFQSVTAAAIDENGRIVIRHGEDFLNNVK